MAKNSALSHHKPLDHPDQLLFRTSTTYLFDYQSLFDQEKRASAVKNINNRLPYFGTGEDQNFLIENAEIIPGEIAQNAKKKAPLFKKQKDKIQRQTKPPIPHQARKTPEKAKAKDQNFNKISNILRDAIAGHKKMKKKLDVLKFNHFDRSKPKAPKMHSPQNKQKRFVFSFSTSPLASTLPSPKKSPHSPRYQVSGSMTDRYNKSQAQIAELRKQIRLSQEQSEMEQCTFRPNLVSKLTNLRILAERNATLKQTSQRKVEQEQNVFIKIHRNQMDQKRAPFKFEEFRELIKFQLDRIPLESDQMAKR